jgi:hypothetical protein
VSSRQYRPRTSRRPVGEYGIQENRLAENSATRFVPALKVSEALSVDCEALKSYLLLVRTLDRSTKKTSSSSSGAPCLKHLLVYFDLLGTGTLSASHYYIVNNSFN